MIHTPESPPHVQDTPGRLDRQRRGALAGSSGDVTRQAEAADCSRQTVYDHAQKVHAAVEVEHTGGPTHAELIQENERLRQENARLWDWLAQTIEFPPGQRHEFTVTATAMGLSLNQVLVLLAIVMGTRARPGAPRSSAGSRRPATRRRASSSTSTDGAGRWSWSAASMRSSSMAVPCGSASSRRA